ncbi:MAG: phosphopantetheine-binding protein [Solimonas sp.]
MDLVELVMALEREFSITIDDMVAEGLDTVDDAIGYVEELVLRKARRAA